MGKYHVVIAGISTARRMVVHQNDGRTVVCQYALQDTSWMNRCTVYRTLKQWFEGDNAMSAVEKQHGKHFVFFAGHFQAQVVAHVLRVFEIRPALE